MTHPTPSSITVVRIAALVQALAAFPLSGFAGILTLAGYVSDRADAAAGHPNEWAGLGEYVGVVVGGLLLGVALILGELITAVPVGFADAAGVHRNPFQGWLLVGAVYLALAVTVVWPLLERPARLWAADRDRFATPTSPVAPW